MSLDYEFHLSSLKKVCRLCGNRVVYITRSSSKVVKKVATYSKAVLEVFSTDVSADDPRLHPANLCNSCYRKLSRKIKRVAIQWEEHSEECKFCRTYAQGSKPGRPVKVTNKGKFLKYHHEHKKHFSSLETKESPTTLGSNFTPTCEVYICPLCRRFLSSPVQTSCNHVYCLDCMRHFTSRSEQENMNCPKCQKPLELKDISIASECFLQTMNFASVTCNKCLALIQVQDTPNHVCKFLSEEQIATKVLKRKLHESREGVSATFKTGGQVHKIFDLINLQKYVSK